MKHSAILLFVLVLTASGPSRLLAQERSNRTIFWLKGPALTSARWDRADDYAKKVKGYKYSRFNDWPYETNPLSKTIPEWAEFFNSKGGTDILGIGHDAGGLILRYMNTLSPNSGLSAMILDGVPNQGARIMRSLLPPVPNPSEAQNLLNKLMDLRTLAQGCNACRMLEAVQRWLNFFGEPYNKTYYDQLLPTSPVVRNLGLPIVPYAVIWGNENEEDGLVLTRLVNSWHNAGLWGEDYEYVECYRKEIDRAKRKEKDKNLEKLVKDVVGFAAGVAMIVAGISTQKLELVIKGVETSVQAISGRIRAVSVEDKTREAFECELIHQALNAQWNLMVSHANFVQDTVAVPCIPCDSCANEVPDPRVGGYCYSVCTAYGCDPVTQLYSYPVYYYQYEPHDGLLTRSEQLLAGAAKTYEAQRVNHFQEQFWEYTPIGNAFQDLFNGGAGAAFVVPK